MALQISHNQIYLFQIQIYLLLGNNYGSCTLNNSIRLEGYKNFVLDEGHGVKGLSDIGLQTLPKQYIQPTQEQISASTILTEESIPVIDMSNSNEQMVADMICNATEKWGFFQIVNHGIPVKMLENVKNAIHRFYGLPAEEKKKYSKKESPTNNVRYGTSFSPQPEKTLGWKDWLSPFYVSDEEAATFWPSICRL